MLIFDVILNIELTNGNDGRGNRWFRTADVRKNFEAHLRAVGHVYSPMRVPVKITLIRLIPKGGRAWDYDSGLRGNSKELIDAMVACGWFFDDAPKWVKGVLFDQMRHPGRDTPGVRVIIEKV